MLWLRCGLLHLLLLGYHLSLPGLQLMRRPHLGLQQHLRLVALRHHHKPQDHLPHHLLMRFWYTQAPISLRMRQALVHLHQGLMTWAPRVDVPYCRLDLPWRGPQM